MNKIKLTQLIITLFLLIGFVQLNPAKAAAASIAPSPVRGNYTEGETITVDIVADGEGTPFNVAESKVAISSNVKVEDVLLGDCNFAFVKTPSTGSLNFLGAILGGKSNKCVVYTLKLKAVSQGTATILLSEAKLKEHPTSKELFPRLTPGQYGISQATAGNSVNNNTQTDVSSTNPTTTNLPTSPPINGKYQVSIAVVTEDDKPAVGATVIITTPSPSSDQQKEVSAITDKDGIARFDGVVAGAHAVKVQSGKSTIADKIVTVGGDNGEMKFTVKGAGTGPNPLIYLIIIILAVLAVGIIMYKKGVFSKRTV